MNYRDFVQTFINETQTDDLLSSVSIFLFRRDGILLFHKIQARQKINARNASSVGALMSGVWQASQALVNLIPESKSNQADFRLAFDTSETGFYLLPLHTKALGEIHLGAVYVKEVNPAQVKSKFRNFAQKLEQALSFAPLEEPVSEDADTANERYLFQNISDKEIDRLFEGARI